MQIPARRVEATRNPNRRDGRTSRYFPASSPDVVACRCTCQRVRCGRAGWRYVQASSSRPTTSHWRPLRTSTAPHRPAVEWKRPVPIFFGLMSWPFGSHPMLPCQCDWMMWSDADQAIRFRWMNGVSTPAGNTTSNRGMPPQSKRLTIKPKQVAMWPSWLPPRSIVSSFCTPSSGRVVMFIQNLQWKYNANVSSIVSVVWHSERKHVGK